MAKPNKNKKVFIAMSGGVDSSVAAYLLKEQGHDCTGVFMKSWSGDNYGIQADCPWEEDQKAAEAACNHLDIPFRSFNFEKEYREKVVEYFFSEYEKGRTPNPDVMCNREIKFGLFLEKSLAEGADMIATGHYVRRNCHTELVEVCTSESSSQHFDKLNVTRTFQLLKGIDSNKDQSYFLYNLTQKQLSRSLFPVGDYQKSEIRKIAKKAGLPNANRPDSQGICFIGEINVQDFLRSRIKVHRGKIIDADTSEIVGKHDGVEFYTLGQREGIGVGGTKEPYFVVGKDAGKNELYVGEGRKHPRLFKSEVTLESIHLIDETMKTEDLVGRNLSASVRYRQKPSKCELTVNSAQCTVDFEEPQRAITPGQSLVLYDGEVCLGGGIIQ